MEMIVNHKQCDGCGLCVGICPNGAIFIHDDKAFVDQSKCTFCQSCIEACSTGALQLLKNNEQIITTNPGPIEVIQPQTILDSPHKKNGPASKVLFLAGQYILPRMINGLINFLELRLASPAQTDNLSPVKTKTSMIIRYGRCRQHRGRMFSQFPIERR